MVVRDHGGELDDPVRGCFEAAVLQPHTVCARPVDTLQQRKHPGLLAGPGWAVEEQVGDLAVLRLLEWMHSIG